MLRGRLGELEVGLALIPGYNIEGLYPNSEEYGTPQKSLVHGNSTFA